MDDQRIGAALRMIRIKKRLRQSDVARLAGVSRRSVGDLERGLVGGAAVVVLRSVAAVLEARVDIEVRWGGADLDRLLATGHAALHELVGGHLRTLPGWASQAEVTFAIYGERGVVGILAWHAETRSLLIIELKTALGDPQELVAVTDRRVRLARRITAERGWQPRTVSTWVVFAESPTNRRHVAAHTVLLRGRFPADGRTMRAWLSRPDGAIHALSFFSDVRQRDRTRPTVTTRRVRRTRAERGLATTGRPERHPRG